MGALLTQSEVGEGEIPDTSRDLDPENLFSWVGRQGGPEFCKGIFICFKAILIRSHSISEAQFESGPEVIGSNEVNLEYKLWLGEADGIGNRLKLLGAQREAGQRLL